MDDNNESILTRVSDLVIFIEDDRPLWVGINPKGPFTTHRSSSRADFLIVGICSKRESTSTSVRRIPLLTISRSIDGIPFKLLRDNKMFLGPGGVTSPVTVTNLFANSKHVLETKVLERLISTPNQSVTKVW